MDESAPVASDVITFKDDLAKRIKSELGQNVYLCYQCVKCTSGCPVSAFFDWQPNQIMRALQLGQEEIALESRTPWLCASCQTCTSRCPQGLDINSIMDFLTREAVERGVTPPLPEVNRFNRAFMREVRLWNRSFEPGLMAEMILHDPGSLVEDLEMYVGMLKKRKVSLFPKPVRKPSSRTIEPIGGASSAVAYYPGCSLETTASEFNYSTQAVCEAIGLKLIEPQGWVCCGSSAAHRSDPEAALRYPLENLILIEQSGFEEVTMPCAACFNRHKTAQYEIRHHDNRKTAMEATLGYSYQETVKVSTLVQAINTHIGPERVAKNVTNPLDGLRVVCYYGCLLTRPPDITEAEHPENPTDMDEIVSALGAEVRDWSYKTTCCGAAHSLTRPDIVRKLSGNIINHARKAGADVVAVACPLCHMNLDARQMKMELDEPMPILYFTQLMALALGLPKKAAALHKNMVDPDPVLQKRAISFNS